MRLTKEILTRIIKEELEAVLDQQSPFVIEEGRFEEDPKFAEDMKLLGKDLGRLIPMLKTRDPKESDRLNLPSLGLEFRGVAGGATRPCDFSNRLQSIFNSFGMMPGQAQAGVMNWLKKYPMCGTNLPQSEEIQKEDKVNERTK
jgi:hypothetical protein